MDLPNYDITPDGQHFIFRAGDEPEPVQLHVILNWFEELKQRVPTGGR